MGVFQCESAGMRKLMKELNPDCFSDIVALIALYRPGPMKFLETFIARKHGREAVTYPHPLFREALEETYGVCVYQEQVMKNSPASGRLFVGRSRLAAPRHQQEEK